MMVILRTSVVAHRKMSLSVPQTRPRAALRRVVMIRRSALRSSLPLMENLFHRTVSGAAGIVLSTILAVCVAEASVSQDYGVPAQLELEEIFRIGDDESTEVSFGFVSALDVNSTGQVFVADGMVNSIYIFSDSGVLTDVVGSFGSGPGEFEDISGIHVGPGDSVYVLDSDLYRLSVFEPRMHRLAYSFRVEGVGLSDPAQLLGVVNNGFLVVYRLAMSPDFGNTVDRQATVNFLSRHGTITNGPIVSLPDWEYAVSSRYTLLIPFGRKFKFHLGGDGLIYSGLSDVIAIQMTTVEGRTQGVVQHDHPTVSVTQKDINNYVSDMSPEAKRLIRQSDLPRTMPAYKTFTVDDRERIWIQRFGEGGEPSGEWLLLNKDGNVVGKAALPVSENLYVIRKGIAYGSGKSESGAPYIVAYRINK